MASNTPSLFKSVAVFSATVLSASTVAGYVAYFNGNTYTVGTAAATSYSGSTLTGGGGTFIATNSADAACRKNTVTGKYYDCHQEAVFTNTGASTGAKYYNVASITKPFTGSGITKMVQVACGRTQTVSARISVDQLANTTTSGTAILNHKLIGSGTYVLSTSVGATNSGSSVWGNATPNIKVSASAAVGPSGACRIMVDSDQM